MPMVPDSGSYDFRHFPTLFFPHSVFSRTISTVELCDFPYLFGLSTTSFEDVSAWRGVSWEICLVGGVSCWRCVSL